MKRRKHAVWLFYVLALVISWIGWAPQVAASRGVAPFTHPVFGLGYLLAGLGPALAAVIVVAWSEGRAGLKRLLAPLWAWRVEPGWYLVALLGPVVLFACATLVDSARAGRFIGWILVAPWYGVLLTLLTSLLSNVWEEIGWRGFALPRLQATYTSLMAALIVGVGWAIWHLPLSWIQGHPFGREPLLAWALGILAESVLYAWLYNRTGGSLLIVALFHAAINTVGGLAYGGSYLGVTIAAWVLAAILVAITGPSLAARRAKPAPDTPNI